MFIKNILYIGGFLSICDKPRKDKKNHAVITESDRRYGGILMLKNCYRGNVLHSDFMIRDDLKVFIFLYYIDYSIICIIIITKIGKS